MNEVVNRNSADENEEKQRTLSLTENSPTSGGGIESEYDTASTNSRSDNERDEYEDDSEDSLDEEISGDEEIDDERESGDGQEELESENGSKKKVDHDEDRSNPQYIPKKGTFYEHDDRTVEDMVADEAVNAPEGSEKNSQEGLSTAGKILMTQNQKVPLKSLKKVKEADRWTHDRFNEYEQAPKSRAELVSAYGYDIRSEDGPPRPRRQRRYGRHQSKYSRNWEDEEAYKKSQSLKTPPRRSLRAEDFPALGSTPKTTRTKEHTNKLSNRVRQHQDENDPKPFTSPEKKREHKLPRDQRNQRYNNDTSNNNNARNVKGKKNINFNHNIEFKNQNRKNINYETSQPKNNNVINQQMHSNNGHNQVIASTSQSQHGAGNIHHNQPNQRFNNSEGPLPTLSFTNSKMNNNSNNANTSAGSIVPRDSSRGILNFDNSSGNYVRISGTNNREKELNSHQHVPAMSPNKNIQQQYSDRQMDQMKFIEKNYSQQQQHQNKATNLNLNQQIPPQDPANNAEMSRSKRYSSLRQRSNINDTPTSLQQQPPQPSPSQQHYHTQYIQQPEIEPTLVQLPPQQNQSYIAQQKPTQPPTSNSNILAAPTQQQPTQPAGVQQQQAPKYQAAYYATNPASEYALMQAAMVEKYQFQPQSNPAQYIAPQQAPQQIYMPTQSQQSQQQQILNYVSTIQPQGPAAAPTYPQYTNYQGYNIPATATNASAPQPSQIQQPPVPTGSQSTPQGIYQTQSGLTYYPNAQIATTHQQRILQPQRRPNPIPILAPPEKNKTKVSGSSNIEETDKNSEDKGVEAENIDHILDNMFVQRPMTNLISLKDPPSLVMSDEQINENMSNMSIAEERKADDTK